MKPAASAFGASMLRILLLLLLAMGILAGFLGCIQRSMIYHPRPYNPDFLKSMPDRLVRVPYEIDGKPQVAFYLPPRDPSQAEDAPLWVLFHGNASTALYWMSWIYDDVAHDNARWLLVDYPGYGMNEGKPTRASIIKATETIIPALSSQIDEAQESLLRDINTLGFSIGAAASMEFAVRHPVQEVVLLSPFTTLEEMARRTVGWPLSEVLIDRFDNTARLRQLAEINPTARVVIVHGDGDSVVPFSHGERLAQVEPTMTRLVKVPAANHGDIFWKAAEVMREILADDPAVPLP